MLTLPNFFVVDLKELRLDNTRFTSTLLPPRPLSFPFRLTKLSIDVFELLEPFPSYVLPALLCTSLADFSISVPDGKEGVEDLEPTFIRAMRTLEPQAPHLTRLNLISEPYRANLCLTRLLDAFFPHCSQLIELCCCQFDFGSLRFLPRSLKSLRVYTIHLEVDWDQVIELLGEKGPRCAKGITSLVFHEVGHGSVDWDSELVEEEIVELKRVCERRKIGLRLTTEDDGALTPHDVDIVVLPVA